MKTMPKNDLLAQASEHAARRAGEPFIQEHAGEPFIQEHVAKAKAKKAEEAKKATEDKAKK